MTLLSVDHMSLTLRGRPVLRNVSLSIANGELVGLLGPNGAGKTSLMRTALGLIPGEGRSSLAALSDHDRARAVAWLPQHRDIAWPMSVERLVTLGRIPYLSPGQRLPAADRKLVDDAIARMGLDAFRARAATRLSGGEQARVLLARALAQDTPLLMADEPVAGLDPAYQIATMEVFADLARAGRSVFVSLHDLGLAARHCTRVVVLAQGQILADGPPGAVMSDDLMARAFGIKVYHEQTVHGPVFQPLRGLT